MKVFGQAIPFDWHSSLLAGLAVYSLVRD
jgi:hypothetical protein